MKIAELVEAITTVGASTDIAGQPAAPTPQLGGNVQQLADPRIQASQLAKQKQDREQQKRDIMAQIKAKQAELQALQKQQTELNRAI